MAYLVRKLNKRESIDLIGKTEDFNSMFADAATTEFRSNNGTLSTWRIETIDKLEDAILAIVVTSSKIERMDFIVINTEILEEHHLEYKNTYAGQKIGVPDLQDTHYDIINITIPKLITCSCVYKEIYVKDNNRNIYIVRKVEGEIKELLDNALKNKRIFNINLNKNIREYLKFYD